MCYTQWSHLELNLFFVIDRPSLLWVNHFAVHPSDGGGTRHFELGRELVRCGWDVTIVAADYHPQKRQYTRREAPNDRRVLTEYVDGVRFCWMWTFPYRHNNWRRALNWLSFEWQVRGSAGLLPRADLVIGSSPHLFAATAARAVAATRTIPFLLEVRDLWPESLVAAGGRRGMAYHVLSLIARGLYRDAHAIIVLARGTGEHLRGLGVAAAALNLIPNGVDVHAIVPSGTDRGATPENGLTLVYAGAHGPANGLDVLLDAAEILEREGRRVRFLLIGDGPSRPRLMSEASRRGLRSVEFRAAMAKHDLAPILAAADAGLMVLRDAPLFSFAVSPNKLFDYFAAGIPVICNVPGEVASIVAGARAGIQASDCSAEALAECVRQLIQIGPSARRQMGVAGRELAERDYSREVLGRRMDGLLRKFIEPTDAGAHVRT